ncbi:beta-1,4 N-acetylgalactosaminyltransferase 2-like [Myxocyprinus asiaticus]|uniref:beta-1,4 N-acetylgalactosaminyltransferase 2-like n=1 Tax=Myxocyprinus asiaticus TaxID=70543 RepID=UPI0022233C0F|nr:beta-1,4 N-acetylgalactosaminyltransferase 2-like [Myxocyprinus asiaticus]
MNCTRHFLLKCFLILLGMTALSICFMQSGMLKSMKGLLESRIGPFLNTNRSSCSSKGALLTKQHIPQRQLKDILKRRAEEYRQHQLRTRTYFDSLIVVPSNSPLQYPVTGFTVSPLTKSVIPGLALHAQKREEYQVSLHVKSGVLLVKNALVDDKVDGQGQNELNISSTSLSHLNNLLGRVTYTSTTYHIRSSDLVNFSFENYEAIFPIMIRRPTVPVLYDPGEDVNSQVTITTKTFLRYRELNVLINSIRNIYPKIKIIIVDDSLNPESVRGDNIEQYIMPPAQGWFAGRNLAVSQVTTKYFLWVDDDFMFLNGTRIESFVEIMEAIPELDILGGAVSGDQYYFNFEYEEGDEEEGGCLKRIKKGYHQPLPGFDGCLLVDGVVNYFLARTDAVRRVGFDPFLKRVAHSEFFMDGLGQLMVASCKGLSVGHQKHRSDGKYSSYRSQKKTDARKKVYHHFFKNYLKFIKF